jgi:hypothetical protein
MNTLINLTGRRFGIWRVIRQMPRRDNKTRWLCECCTCGAQISHRSTALRLGKFAKCFGTHRRRVSAPSPLKKPSGYAAATETWGRYKQAAGRRRLTFSLTREEFVNITAQDCHYCGAPPSQRSARRHFNGAFIYTGIDRKDSGSGYDATNCLPCCATCNVMKQDLSYDGFLNHITRIATLRPGTTFTQERMALGRGGNTRPANIENVAEQLKGKAVL